MVAVRLEKYAGEKFSPEGMCWWKSFWQPAKRELRVSIAYAN